MCVRFPCSAIQLMWLMTMTWVWLWRPQCRCLWYGPACPQRLMTFVLSIRVWTQGGGVPNHSGELLADSIAQNQEHSTEFLLCQGVFEQMIGGCTIGKCCATSIATPCSAWRFHLPEAVRHQIKTEQISCPISMCSFEVFWKSPNPAVLLSLCCNNLWNQSSFD